MKFFLNLDQSEDGFPASIQSLNNPTDEKTASSNSQLLSDAAHTSSSDFIRTTSEPQPCTLDNDNNHDNHQNDQAMGPVHKVSPPSASAPTMNETKDEYKFMTNNFSFFLINIIVFSESILNDDPRVPVINHLVDDLHQRLNELEDLFSTVNKILVPFTISFSLVSLLRFHKVRIHEMDY
jgi:hypothetical protein